MTFYLGTHQTAWLGRTDVPLFVSRRRLAERKSFPAAAGRWALDSGGFTELSMFGTWTIGPAQYIAEIRRFSDEIGRLDWAAPQDWMCEPFICAKTGKTVAEHQVLTVDNFIELKSLAPELKIIPVLQGWAAPEDYLRHVEMYSARGIDLTAHPVVGVGSVCRRQAMGEAQRLMRQLRGMGISPHGFGFKLAGIRQTADVLGSADSMAWSFTGRRRKQFDDCTHKNCANCFRWAMKWRDKVMKAIAAPRHIQGELFTEAA